jgi:hypothetical protein
MDARREKGSAKREVGNRQVPFSGRGWGFQGEGDTFAGGTAPAFQQVDPSDGMRRGDSRAHAPAFPIRRGTWSHGRAGLPADARGEKAMGGRGHRRPFVAERRTSGGPAPTPAAHVDDAGFPRCQDMGRLVQGPCAPSCGFVFRVLGRKGLVPASAPDPGTSAGISARVVGPLRAPRGT